MALKWIEIDPTDISEKSRSAVADWSDSIQRTQELKAIAEVQLTIDAHAAQKITTAECVKCGEYYGKLTMAKAPIKQSAKGGLGAL